MILARNEAMTRTTAAACISNSRFWGPQGYGRAKRRRATLGNAERRGAPRQPRSGRLETNQSRHVGARLESAARAWFGRARRGRGASLVRLRSPRWRTKASQTRWLRSPSVLSQCGKRAPTIPACRHSAVRAEGDVLKERPDIAELSPLGSLSLLNPQGARPRRSGHDAANPRRAARYGPARPGWSLGSRPRPSVANERGTTSERQNPGPRTRETRRNTAQTSTDRVPAR